MNLYQAIFLRSVQQFPNNTALYIEGSSTKSNSANSSMITNPIREKTFTYHDLFELSQQWGNYINQLNDEQHPVSIYGERQWQMYAGILAILSTNSAYVPLSNKQPASRNTKVLSQIQSKVLLVAEGEDPTTLLQLTRPSLIVLYLGTDTPLWLENHERHSCFAIEDVPLESNNAKSQLKKTNRNAYILFTSGSTGTPKGIAVSHENIINHLNRLDKLLAIQASDKVSQFFELSFDLSVHDMFSCWSKGAALYVIPSEQLLCPMPFIKQHQLTVFSGVASILSFMDKLSLLKVQQLPSLRLSCFGGEKLLTNQALKWQKCANNSRVINLYGPTECTITATYFELSDNHTITSASVPIGKALSGLSAILVNNNQKVTTANTLAELYLAGDQLVEGYYQDKKKTQQAFITLKNPLAAEATRYYRTGDIVYYDEQKNIVFHGRNDHQFKVSGHRVEAAEIEAAIVNFSANISWCVISAQTTLAGNTNIIAFIEVDKSISISLNSSHKKNLIISELRKHCLQKLPSYMLPDEFNFYSYLPRNISGKVDIKALLNANKYSSACNITKTKEVTPC